MLYVNPYYYSENKGSNPKRHRQTPHRKKILSVLLEGGHISRWQDKYRVWDKKGVALNRCSVGGFLAIKKYLTAKDGGYVIDAFAVNKLRPNTWVKKQYLLLKNKT
jgi:hypothetical protein